MNAIIIQNVNITIDTNKLAKGLYGIMPEDAKNLMSIGMIDSDFIVMLETHLKDKAEETALFNIGKVNDWDSFVSNYVKEISKLVQKELYQVAEMIV